MVAGTVRLTERLHSQNQSNSIAPIPEPAQYVIHREASARRRIIKWRAAGEQSRSTTRRWRPRTRILVDNSRDLEAAFTRLSRTGR